MGIGGRHATGPRPGAHHQSGGIGELGSEPGALDGSLPFAVWQPSLHDAARCSRGTRQRAGVKSQVLGRIVESMVAINSLAGFKTTYVNSFAEMTEEGRRIFRDIEGKHKINVKPETGMDPKEAFKELLGASSSPYASGGKTEPYLREKVAWPDVSSSPVRLETLVPGGLKTYVDGSDKTWMWMGADLQERLKEEGRPRLHGEPALRRGSSEYREFLKDGLIR